MSLVSRLDSFINLFTGLGSTMADKTRAVRVVRDPVLQPDYCATLFQTSDTARIICSAIVDDAMRQGFDVKQERDDETDDDAETTQDEDKQLARIARTWDVRARVHEARIWGRTFGGSAIWVGVDGKQAEPLDVSKIVPGSVRSLKVLDRRDLQPESFYSNPDDPKLGEVERYRVRVQGADGGSGSEGSIIHETRLIRFGGALTDVRARMENARWDYSVLQAVYEILIDSDSNWKSLVALMSDFGQGVFKIKNLMQMIASGREDVVRTRMAIVDEGRSSLRSLILDADGEDFERKATPVAGLPEIMMIGFQRLASAAEMPVTRLMGMSPAGMNATGESDTRNWYDRVQHERDTKLTPPLTLLMGILAANEGLQVECKISWPSLWQMNDTEFADYYLKISTADKNYNDIGAALPEEIGLSRFGSGHEFNGRSMSTFDVDARQRALKLALKDMVDPLPPPPALPPGQKRAVLPPAVVTAGADEKPAP